MPDDTTTNATPNTLTIDDVTYDTDKLSETAKQQLGYIRFVDLEIARLNLQLNVAQTARTAYGAALREALTEPGENGS